MTPSLICYPVITQDQQGGNEVSESSVDDNMVLTAASALGGVGGLLWIIVIVLAIIGGVMTYKKARNASKSLSK